MLRRSIRFFAWISVTGVTVLTGIASIGPTVAQPAATTSGTLTCTVADVPSKANSIVDLSCNYKSHAGVTSDYVGYAGTRTGGFPPAKFVFIWTVVAIDAGKAPILDGTFTAKSGRAGPAVLIGGNDGTTRLEPATGVSQVPGPAEITTLKLELAPTKT